MTFGSELATFGRDAAFAEAIGGTVGGVLFTFLGIVLLRGEKTRTAGLVLLIIGLLVILGVWLRYWLTTKSRLVAQASGVETGFQIARDFV